MKGNQFWWMISFLALAALLALLFFIVIPAHGSALYFGTPKPQCPVEGHKGPVCDMESCKAMDKDGKKTGSNCSKYCAKTCCSCSDACPREQNQNSPNDEEYIVYQFGD